MADSARIQDTIGILYESALIPEMLGEALSAMVDLLDGDTCHLVGWDRETGIPSLSVSAGLAPDIGPGYAAHYAHIDPRRSLSMTMAPGQILACHEHFDTRFVSSNEFYQDYLLPQVGLHHLLGAGDLIAESGQLVLIGFQRHVGHRHFNDEEIRLLEQLLPHLQRTLRLREKLALASDTATCAETTLENAHLATILLTSAGKVLWSNRYAESLLSKGVWIHQSNARLRARDAAQDNALQTAIRNTARHGQPANLNLGNAPSHCCLTLLNVSRRLSDHVDGHVLVLISVSGGRRIASVQQLMDLFRLSPAEARLTRALAQGESVERYADQEGLKRSTIKTQLTSALTKTGMRGQKDLIRLVIDLPAIRPDLKT